MRLLPQVRVHLLTLPEVSTRRVCAIALKYSHDKSNDRDPRPPNFFGVRLKPFNKIVRAIFMQQLATTSRLTSGSEAMPVVTVEMISPSISLQPTTMRPCVRVV